MKLFKLLGIGLLLSVSSCLYAPYPEWGPHRDFAGHPYEQNTETHSSAKGTKQKPKIRKDVADIKQKKKK